MVAGTNSVIFFLPDIYATYYDYQTHQHDLKIYQIPRREIGQRMPREFSHTYCYRLKIEKN